jgi:hypothetical protein
MKKIPSLLSCFCLVAVMGINVWHFGIRSKDRDTAAGSSIPGGAYVSDFAQEKKEQAALADNGGDLDGNPLGYATTNGQSQENEGDKTELPSHVVNVDVPVQNEAVSTGALNALDTVWGGSYMDEDGHWVVWLTENTKENQQKVFEQNPDLLESTTMFKTADYSLAYLTQLMADISEGVGDGKLPYVTTAALMEQDNRVEVTMTTDEVDKVALIQRFDTIGGAIEIRYTTSHISDKVDVLIKK